MCVGKLGWVNRVLLLGLALCRSQLASILLASTITKCQQLTDKVSEIRFLQVRERQINKFNRLLQKRKEI